MEKEKLIIIEGPQGAGKTTVTDYIRNTMAYTNLYRLSGISDSSKTGFEKTKEMYENLLNYIKLNENKSLNLVFDRIFTTEEVFCRLGAKDYSFTEEYEKLLKKLNELDFEIYYINLYLDDESEFEKRLNREGKAELKYMKFNIQNSINQQNMYKQISEEIKEKSKNIKVVDVNSNIEREELFKKINSIIYNEEKI